MENRFSLDQILNRTEDIKEVGINNGVKTVTFEEQRDLAARSKMENMVIDDLPEFNPDGTLKRTPGTRYAAVNLDHYYINRFKKVKEAYWIITDYRAIQEQSTGVVYTNSIPCYVVVADENGEPKLDKMVSVSDKDFVADFTHILDRESMAYLMERKVFDTSVGITQEKLSFKKGDTK